MNEEWRDIAGYEDRYQVSSYGRVKSIAKCWQVKEQQMCLTERIMKIQTHYRGYLFVHLRKPGIHKKEFIHRLVALAFLPNPDGKDVVNHKDRNRAHNCAFGCSMCITGNLEWVTYGDNNRHYMALDRAARESDIPF
jgi:hypothetical protein